MSFKKIVNYCYFCDDKKNKKKLNLATIFLTVSLCNLSIKSTIASEIFEIKTDNHIGSDRQLQQTTIKDELEQFNNVEAIKNGSSVDNMLD